MYRYLILSLLLLPVQTDENKLREKADKIHRSAIVVDTHNDITSPIADQGFDMGAKDTSGKTQTDIPRLKEGGAGATFFSIYVAAKYAKEGGAARRAMEMIDGVFQQVKKHPDSLELAYTAQDIRRIRKSGKMAALMGIEGGHAIEDSLSALRIFYNLGIRYMTLTHTNTNNWADSAGGISVKAERRHGGLNDLGKQVVSEMNKLGMLIDISHVSDETFYQCIELSKAPLIASHSSCRELTNVTRNMSDDMLRALAKNGGVIMINFYNGFINTEYAKPGMPPPATSAKTATLDMLMQHFEHAIKVAGIDHVGIGSDFDGVDGELPTGMEDVSKLPTITYELLKRGYSETDIKKVLGENILRVMSENEKVAKQFQVTSSRVQDKTSNK